MNYLKEEIKLNTITPHSTSLEEKLKEKGYLNIAGVDEVGRGCFAGPLVAASVILPEAFPFKEYMQDSKLLNSAKREKLSAVIKLYALSFAIVEIPVSLINSLGVGYANQQALSLSIQQLGKKPDFVLVDGFTIRNIKPSLQKAIIHGDRLHASIAAASILAKVYRDQLMDALHATFPLYNFTENKGYGTKKHRLAITKYGLSPLHRTSFNLQKYL